jgi:hypothetical protein
MSSEDNLKKEITPVTEPNPSNPVSPSQFEYDHLLSYFKDLVKLTTTAISVLIIAGGVLFYSNMKDVREDAKQEATRVATSEAKAAVAEAFNEKNINGLFLSAAQQKVGTITDKMIEQQLTSKLRPVQERIVLIGQISESEMRMRMGFRSGLDELTGLLKRTADPDVLRFGRSTLAATSQDFETRLQEGVKGFGGKAMPVLQTYLINTLHRPQQSMPGSIHDVVQIIHQDADLNAVGGGFLAFRELTGEQVKMFDFGSITSWCSQNQGKC